jgi:iron complex transport system ATP-binding protein
MTALIARDITVVRGGKTILNGVSADFAGGSFTAVIGPNGAGKSTLMSVLAGLMPPDRGTVTLDGAALDAVPKRRLAQLRAYLPQNARCEWPITVERVVALGLTPILPAFGRLPAAEQARVDRALEACDLVAFRDQPATTLSGGELARAMLARAIVGEPKILMADEPTAGLDPRHALDAMTRLRGFAKAGRMVIVAMHDLSLALPFADRVVALREGAVVVDGPVETAVTRDMLKQLYEVEAQVDRDAEGIVIRFLKAR